MPFVKLSDIEKRKIIEGTEVRFVHSDSMTLAHWNFKSGANIPEHSHHHEQMTRVINGEFELTIDGESQVLTNNDVAVIPPHAVHSGKALTECYIIDVFHPVRKDYR